MGGGFVRVHLCCSDPVRFENAPGLIGLNLFLRVLTCVNKLDKLFGAWKDSRDADKIINDIRKSQ
ncbi:MAG: hypothetical protein B6I19_10185 [Bacteroidetes bacterium 4572_114]|nr:MAG: hypothetical protein B6I19_10185 [Bacteroidetes bacterium 4572_114]